MLDSAFSGTVTLNRANTFTGGVAIKKGTVVVGIGNATTVSGALGPSASAATLGDAAGGSASLLANQFTVSNPINLGVDAAGTLTIGNNGGTTAPTFSGPIALNGDNLTISRTGTTGAMTVSGGITGTGNLILNNAGSTSTLTLSVNAINNAGAITLQGASTGTTTISGGVGANVTSVTQNSATSALTLTTTAGNLGADATVSILQGTINQSVANALGTNSPSLAITPTAGTGLYNLTGAFSQTLGGVALGGATGTTANITIGTGSLTLGGDLVYDATSDPDGASISGGTLALGAAQRTFAIGDSAATSDELTVSSQITASAGFVKAGAGTMKLSRANVGLSGDIAVTAGRLALGTNNCFASGATVDIAGGKVDLAAGTITVVNKLYFDGALQPSGSYGATGSGAQYIEDTRFAGTGILTVGATGNLTWNGDDPDTDNWSADANWVGDVAPVSPMPGRLTFDDTDVGNVNRLDADRTLNGGMSVIPTGGGVHTTDLGGNTLTLNGGTLYVAGQGTRSTYNGSLTVTNGTLRIGTVGTKANLHVA